MKNSRRAFIQTGLTSSVAAAILPNFPIQDLVGPKPRIKLSISSYSYWHFKEKKFPIEAVIDEAAKLGVEGIDILHRQMESEEKSYINKLKRHAFLNGIAFTCLSIHQSFVSPDKEVLRKEIEHTTRCITLAAEMGIPCLRLNSGRKGTLNLFAGHSV